MPRLGLKGPRHKPKIRLPQNSRLIRLALEFAAEAPNDHLSAMEAWRQRFVALATRDKDAACAWPCRIT